MNARHKSLYIGLILNVILGILLGVIGYSVITVSATMYIKGVYLDEEHVAARRDECAEEFREYVSEHDVTISTSDLIADWARAHPYVYVIVYDAESDDAPEKPVPEDAPNREELVAEAESRGFYEIQTSEGVLMAEISEFSHELYYEIIHAVALVVAALVITVTLINYFRIIVKRIKRVESDVTIVSQIDMDYEIASDGNDEIATLARNVELMRQKLLLNVSSAERVKTANNELIAALSHDIRTPLTILLGYLEMMKNHEGCDEVMMDYVEATENTAMRLKQLSDDMFKYTLAFGDVPSNITLEEYDAATLVEQILSEHIYLLRDGGYKVKVEFGAAALPEGTLVKTDAQNLMRIIDNIFSNLRKYADKSKSVIISTSFTEDKLTIEIKNKIATYSDEAESNGIGLKSCVRLAKLVADRFEYSSDGEYFTSLLVLNIEIPVESSGGNGK